MTSDGLIEIVLGKDYGRRKAGSTIRVDPARAAWLRARKYEVVEPKDEKQPEAKAPAQESA